MVEVLLARRLHWSASSTVTRGPILALAPHLLDLHLVVRVLAVAQISCHLLARDRRPWSVPPAQLHRTHPMQVVDRCQNSRRGFLSKTRLHAGVELAGSVA